MKNKNKQNNQFTNDAITYQQPLEAGPLLPEKTKQKKQFTYLYVAK